MSMFNWEASASDKSSSRVVSSYFWVYWAVTVPLTLIVAFSWRLWWNWEKHNFDRDVRIEIENIEEPASWNPSKDLLKSQSGEEIGAFTHVNGWRSLHRRKKTSGATGTWAVGIYRTFCIVHMHEAFSTTSQVTIHWYSFPGTVLRLSASLFD